MYIYVYYLIMTYNTYIYNTHIIYRLMIDVGTIFVRRGWENDQLNRKLAHQLAQPLLTAYASVQQQEISRKSAGSWASFSMVLPSFSHQCCVDLIG